MKLKVKRLRPDAKLPARQHQGDAGLDLFASEACVLQPGEVRAVSTGIAAAVPEGCAGLIWDKSGISLKGVHRLAGVVDAGYRGEVKVVMINLGREPFQVDKGMKIAQMLVQRVESYEVVEVQDLDETPRGRGGFGSTGQF